MGHSSWEMTELQPEDFHSKITVNKSTEEPMRGFAAKCFFAIQHSPTVFKLVNEKLARVEDASALQPWIFTYLKDNMIPTASTRDINDIAYPTLYIRRMWIKWYCK